MNRRLPILLVLLAAALDGAWAGDTRQAVLFVTSTPIRAEVSLAGRPVGRTPLLLKDLPPGRYALEVTQDGYRSVSFDLLLAPGETRVLDFPLAAAAIHSTFPADPQIVVAGRVEESAGRVFLLEEGRFNIEREAGLTYLDPLYPRQRMIDALNLSIPIMLIFAGALTVDAVYNPPQPRRPLPASVLAAHGITLGMIGLDIALNLNKRKLMRSYRLATLPQEGPLQEAWRLYREGERLLARGALAEARAEYERIARTCGNSDALPWALCRIADILYLEGNHDAAAREYARVVQEYPIPQLYDRCCKNLADLHLHRGRYEESIRFLDEMVFLDPLFSRPEIDRYRREILERSEPLP